MGWRGVGEGRSWTKVAEVFSHTQSIMITPPLCGFPPSTESHYSSYSSFSHSSPFGFAFQSPERFAPTPQLVSSSKRQILCEYWKEENGLMEHDHSWQFQVLRSKPSHQEQSNDRNKKIRLLIFLIGPALIFLISRAKSYNFFDWPSFSIFDWPNKDI